MGYRKAGILALAFGISCIVREKYFRRQVQELKAANDKLSDNYQLLNHWLEVCKEGRSTAEYFQHMGYQHIAVYGMAELANRLSEDLEGSGIQIDYGIDRDVSCTIARIEEVYSLQDELPETEAVIVTPYYAFDHIYQDLKNKVNCPIISIEDVIWSV